MWTSASLRLLLITLIGATLRLWQLGSWSFWQDEVLTFFDARQFSLAHFQINPIPYLAVKVSMAISGPNEFGARLIPALVGILTIPLIYLLGKVIYNQRVGMWSAGFLSVCHWHLFWSQNARSYIFTCFFAALTAICFFQAIEKKQVRWAILSLVSVSLLIMSHILAGVMMGSLVAYVVYLFFTERKQLTLDRWKVYTIFFSPFALSTTLLIWPYFRQYLFSGWGHNEWNRSLIYIMMTLVYGLSLPVAVTALLAVLARPISRDKIFLLCYCGVPLVFFSISSFFLNVAGYYLFFTLPGYVVLAAWICDQIWVTQSKLLFRLALPSVIVLTLVSQVYLYFQLEHGGRPRWKAAFETIQTQFQAEDRLVSSLTEMSDFYLPSAKSLKIEPIKMPDSLPAGRTWFVVDNDRFNVFDPEYDFRQRLQQRARLVASFPAVIRFKDRKIDLYLLE